MKTDEILISNNLIIRDYQPEDFKQICDLWQVSGMGHPIRGDSNEVIVRTIAHGGKFIIMEEKSTHEIWGTSWLTSDGRRVMLHHFAILPRHRGKGLSKVLLRESLDFVKLSGLQVKLEVHSSNSRAIELYNKFGFKLLEDFQVYIIRDVANL